MTATRGGRTRLFYSYSHKDQQYQERMETALALLRDQDGLLDDWSDRKILPGEHITRKIKARMEETHIFVFLLSPDFLASRPCRDEWSQARALAGEDDSIVLVPVILRRCSWKDLEQISELKALPNDAQPVSQAADPDTAWHEIYVGLKRLLDERRSVFAVRPRFRKHLLETRFLSQAHVSLEDLFVFPTVSSYAQGEGDELDEKPIDTLDGFLDPPFTLLHGENLSGKTALLHHSFLQLADRGHPVLYLDLQDTRSHASPDIFRHAYETQYLGDYDLWQQRPGKTILIDNLGPSKRDLGHVLLAAQRFDTVLVTVSTQTYFAYFRDESRLADFRVAELLPLTHQKQEELIRLRLAVTHGQPQAIPDGLVDQAENRVNAVVLNNRILPRYPFSILSILQTFEGFVPSDVTVTSYGHCYYVLILSHLVKAGVPKSDDAIGACLNFAEHLAFKLYAAGGNEGALEEADFAQFVATYRSKFVLKDSLLNRLRRTDYGLVNNGQFRDPYMYYFFLGRFLAKKSDEHRTIIDELVDKSYLSSNSLALMFTIHHTTDHEILDDILLGTMCSLDTVEPSSLDEEESRFFEDLLGAIPSRILSKIGVPEERRRARELRDTAEAREESEPKEREAEEPLDAINDAYRIMKNSDVLGQILKNKYGSLTRDKIAEVIETVADGGLRLVRILLGRQEEMNELAAFVRRSHPDLKPEQVSRMVQGMAFVWTMMHVERVVRVLNGPEIRPLVEDVVAAKSSPAYELIGYFLRLDTNVTFRDTEVGILKKLLKKHNFLFFRKVLSLRTQMYLNTHRVPAPIEQATCSALGIRYRSRVKRLR